MKLTLFAVLLIFYSSQPLAAQSKSRTSELEWKTFNTGLENAKTSHRKILVDVYTDWCSWCKKMDKEVYTDPSVKDYLTKNFVTVKMNAEGAGMFHYKGQEYSAAQLAAAFGVTGYPATLFLQEEGDPITILPGYVEAPMFVHVLSYIADNEYRKKQFDDYLKEKGVSR